MADFSKKIDVLKQKMKERDIPVFFVQKPENVLYLSGFRSTNCTLLFTQDRNYLLTDSRYIEAAERLSPLYELVLTSKERTLLTLLSERKFPSLGIEEDVIHVSYYKELLGCFADEKSCILRADGMVEDLRAVKDEEELLAIQKAEALGDRCFSNLLEFVKPGMSEREAAREIEGFFIKNGAERLSFSTICASGKRSSLPHGEPTEKCFEKGDLITFDFGCVVDGYCSDMTRTIALGKASAEQKEIYNIVLAAQMAGCSAVKAGVSCSEVDRIARQMISDAGYGAQFGHGTGHGVGLEIHEAPTLNPGSEQILQEGMVVSIEPGIYLPKKFGVRIEDLAIVTVSGIINTTKSMKELIEL
ncbi:MAG: aminopeptidase P family protein [Eubacteriales bacterium]|nr:aminopeptidase P family protein [Eubacteriales bacterium]